MHAQSLFGRWLGCVRLTAACITIPLALSIQVVAMQSCAEGSIKHC